MFFLAISHADLNNIRPDYEQPQELFLHHVPAVFLKALTVFLDLGAYSSYLCDLIKGFNIYLKFN